MSELFDAIEQALRACDCDVKCELTVSLLTDWRAGRMQPGADASISELREPGRPERPLLVSPRAVERRQVSTLEGRAALLHSIAHIEFNAINLALDAAYRFRSLPSEYYGDWLTVAAEEAHHFTLLRTHLRSLGYDYGSFTAHNGLWEMALKTAHDPLVRMALVPRVLEARGLDVSPILIAKLRSCNDERAVEILQLIQRDEVGHVRIGNRWYRHLCEARGVDPVGTFQALLAEYGARLRLPFDGVARLRAGFSQHELDLLAEIAVNSGA